MEDEGGGVLGNLPSSRPGRRSEKRSGAARAGAKSTGTRRTTAAKDRPRPRAAASGEPAPAAGDPLGGAVRTATQLAEAGLRVGVAVTREVLRRVPRP